jgi:hypothetical protein
MNLINIVGRVGVEPTYEHLIRVSDATGLPYAPYFIQPVKLNENDGT